MANMGLSFLTGLLNGGVAGYQLGKKFEASNALADAFKPDAPAAQGGATDLAAQAAQADKTALAQTQQAQTQQAQTQLAQTQLAQAQQEQTAPTLDPSRWLSGNSAAGGIGGNRPDPALALTAQPAQAIAAAAAPTAPATPVGQPGGAQAYPVPDRGQIVTNDLAPAGAPTFSYDAASGTLKPDPIAPGQAVERAAMTQAAPAPDNPAAIAPSRLLTAAAPVADNAPAVPATAPNPAPNPATAAPGPAAASLGDGNGLGGALAAPSRVTQDAARYMKISHAAAMNGDARTAAVFFERARTMERNAQFLQNALRISNDPTGPQAQQLIKFIGNSGIPGTSVERDPETGTYTLQIQQSDGTIKAQPMTGTTLAQLSMGQQMAQAGDPAGLQHLAAVNKELAASALAAYQINSHMAQINNSAAATRANMARGDRQQTFNENRFNAAQQDKIDARNATADYLAGKLSDAQAVQRGANPALIAGRGANQPRDIKPQQAARMARQARALFDRNAEPGAAGRADAAPPARDKLEKGKVYTNAQGQSMRWTGEKFEAVK